MEVKLDDTASRPAPEGDKALSSIEGDEYGLVEIIDRLSKTLATMIVGDGYALGIEGPWGCGKSTFVNFLTEALAEISGQRVIRFEPWLIGDKRMLIAGFISLLASEIDKIEESSEFGSSFTKWQRERAGRKIGDAIRKYGKSIATLAGPIGGAALLDPTGAAGFTAIGLKSVGALSNLFQSTPPLETLKAEIVTGLSGLQKTLKGIRFNVIIDDVDRLPPEEAVEILRMVQKVADFPCVTYLICYDSNVLSEQVRQTLSLKDGRGFTEKNSSGSSSYPAARTLCIAAIVEGETSEGAPRGICKNSGKSRRSISPTPLL